MNKVIAVYFNQSTVKSSIVCAHILFHLTLITLSRPLLSIFLSNFCQSFSDCSDYHPAHSLLYVPPLIISVSITVLSVNFSIICCLPLNITVTNKCEQLPWKFYMTFVTINHKLQQISFHATAFYSRKQLDID